MQLMQLQRVNLANEASALNVLLILLRDSHVEATAKMTFSRLFDSFRTTFEFHPQAPGWCSPANGAVSLPAAYI
jgi:hypothetical protein